MTVIDGFILGYLFGCAFTYIVLVRPIIRLKDNYIERLETRLKEK